MLLCTILIIFSSKSIRIIDQFVKIQDLEFRNWLLDPVSKGFVKIICRNDQLSSTMSWVGCTFTSLKSLINKQGRITTIRITLKRACLFIRDFRVKDLELLILFLENSQILLKISVIPKDFFRTFNVLSFSRTHLALWRGKKGQGKRPKVHAKQKGIKNFFSYSHSLNFHLSGST